MHQSTATAYDGCIYRGGSRAGLFLGGEALLSSSCEKMVKIRYLKLAAPRGIF